MSLLDDLDALVVAPPDWHADALCQEYPEVTFFPERGESTGPAKALCSRCLVREECLAYALASETLGVWGGTSDQERRALRRAQEAA